jgi:HlyD family secretion protein
MKKTFLILVIVASGIAAAGWLLWSQTHGKGNDTLRLHGNVDIREVNVGFRVSGRVAEVLKDEGDPVREGEELARLDDEPYRREADQAKAQVAAGRSRLEWLQAGYRSEEIAQARAEVKAREVAAENAKRLRDRRQALVATKVVAEENYTDAEAAYHEADARLKSAQAQLSLLETGYRQEEIDQARASLDQAEAALASAQLKVRDTVLKAPSDGVVLTRVEEAGAILQAGRTVLTISLSEPVWVRAYIEEPDLGRVHPGMKVKVFTDSQPDTPYEGQIGFISPRAEFTPKNVETAELRTSLVYRLRIVIANPDEGLRQGMPVTAVVDLSSTR